MVLFIGLRNDEIQAFVNCTLDNSEVEDEVVLDADLIVDHGAIADNSSSDTSSDKHTIGVISLKNK